MKYYLVVLLVMAHLVGLVWFSDMDFWINLLFSVRFVILFEILEENGYFWVYQRKIR